MQLAHEEKEAFARHWLADRERGRRDLLWLCNDILAYKDVSRQVHGPILDQLQKFQGRREVIDANTLKIVSSEPRVKMEEMEGPRNQLFLYPRGHLKSTLITMAHSIQWIINYEDVRILIDTAISEQGERFVQEIKAHFQFNQRFRFLYPEYCPPSKKAGDFGSRTEFTVPNRRRKWLKEPTISAISVGRVIASGHFDVHKHSDLVDKANINTPAQIKEVNSHFGYTRPLREHYSTAPFHSWVDVEGTPYDFSDLYNTIIESEEKRDGTPGNEHEFQITMKSAVVDEEKKLTLWPERYPWEELMKIKSDPTVGLDMFSAQYLMRCIPSEGGLAQRDHIRTFPAHKVKELIPYYRIHATIDLAGMEKDSDGDYTVITTCGFDRDGRCDVLEILRGHFTAHHVIELMFNLKVRYPTIRDIKMEKDSHTRVLLPFLEREQAKRGVWLPIVTHRRDPRFTKQSRIKALQPWFQTGIIRFADNIECLLDVINEVIKFPRFRRDDILDTLADQMQNRDSKGANLDVLPDSSEVPPHVANWQVAMMNRFMGFHPETREPVWSNDGTEWF